MSFRNNLQHLRAIHGMTQEQLAMLCGVSRQSVTKWESERAYPEMDKLIKLCRIFDCTLDELVQGDLTQRSAVTQTAAPVGVGAQDVCGYDEHMRRHALRMASGVAAIIGGVGVAVFADLAIGHLFSFDAVLLAVIFIGVLVGLACIIPASFAHAAFVRAHPFVEDFYAYEDRKRASQNLALALVIGIGLIFVGVAGASFIVSDMAVVVLMFCVAAAVWLFIYFGMMYGRTNLDDYNDEALDEMTEDQIRAAGFDPEQADGMIRRRRQRKRLGAACGIIMLFATIVALLILFLSSALDNQTAIEFFWAPWPIGGICCAIVAIAMENFAKNQ